jgi:hypothetical protein
LLLRYTQALITQMTQTAACNRHHSVEQQLCRWLLSTLDRVPSHEWSSRRNWSPACWACAGKASPRPPETASAGFIRYRRGHISVLNRIGLEAGACECYAVVKTELARLLSDVQHRREIRAVA